MIYHKLAAELLNCMQALHKARPHKHINESLQGEAFVLHFIAHIKNSVTPSEISQEMDVSSARVAAALNSLENKGLIVRSTDEIDRRKVIVNMTEKGRVIADRQYEMVINMAAKMLSFLGEEDAKEYVRITGKMADIATINEDS